jgi:poly(A) polymerase Pap1
MTTARTTDGLVDLGRRGIYTKAFRRFLGVTPPISTLGPNDRDRQVTDTLMEELKRQKTFESEEESRNRYVMTGGVSSMLNELTCI